MIAIFNGLLLKEFREAFRDRRAIFAGLFMIVMGPILMAGLMLFQIEQVTEVEPIYVEFNGSEHAPVLVDYLANKKILARADMPKDQREKWQNMPIKLTIPTDFSDKLAQGTGISLILNADFSHKNLMQPLRRIRSTIAGYSANIGNNRLLMRGIDPRIVNPITLNNQNTATRESKSGYIMGILVTFIMVSLFTASMTASIDTSAGERERHSLELILCQPVPTSLIVMSKVICVSVYGALAAILTMISMTLTMALLPLEKIGMSVVANPLTMLIIAIMILPLAYLAGIFQLFFAYRAKSFKEAQSYLSMLLTLPMLVAMAIALIPHKPQWLDYVPLAGQQLLIESLYKGEEVSLVAFISTGLVTLALAGLMTALLAKSLTSEKVILGLS
ncbi:MAG: ABC transporter permease [Gammaproteobacteria bacterium]|nr:ABC transporter permease [Gammaproteobacteria bacterium]